MSSQPQGSGAPLRHRRLLIAYSIFIVLCVILGLSLRIAFQPSRIQDPQPERILPLPEPANRSEAVELGLFVDNVYTFEPDKRTYDADGWVWLTWPGSLQRQFEDQGLTPMKLLHFVNQVDDWDFSLEPDNELPVPLPDGRRYQRFRFSGHFYVSDLNFRRFPFQTLRIPIVIELGRSRMAPGGPGIPLVVDRTHSGIGGHIDLGGYVSRGFEIREGLHEYPSSLGDPGATANSLGVPQIRLDIHSEKQAFSSIMKFMLPLITIMTLALLSPALSCSGWDVRVGIPPTAMLTLIFLQQGYQVLLPELHYLIFLDTVYNLCYLVNLILFGLFVWGTNEYSSATEDEKPGVMAMIDRMDQRFQIGLTLFLLLGVGANWLVLGRDLA